MGRRQIKTAVAALAIALLLPASAQALDRTVTVRGTATQEVVNDAATMSFSVSKERRTRQAALRAVALRLQAVIAAVQTVPGVGAGDVTTGRITVREVTRGEQTLYRAAEGIVVILHQPERAGELVNVAIGAGATGTRGPNFFPSDPDAAYNAALLTAFDKAKAKAAGLAARAGAILGAVLTIEETTEVVPNSAPRGPRRGGEATPPTLPGESTVMAAVRVVFALE
jgi:uncharacterized protein YggE